MVGGAARGSGRDRGSPPSATRGGGRGRRSPPSAARGDGRGRGTPPSAARGGGRGRGTPPSAARGDGRGRGSPPSAARGDGRGRGKPPKKAGPGRPPKKAVKPKSKTSAGQKKKAVQPKSDPVTAIGHAPEKSVRGKRKSAVNIPLVNVARHEAVDSQNKPSPSKKSKLEPITPVASPSTSQKKKVSAKVGEEYEANYYNSYSKVEDAFTNDTTFLENKGGNSSFSTAVPQDNTVPVSPAQCAVDFYPDGFKNPSCTVSRVQNSKLGDNGTHQIQTNASHGSAVIHDTIKVSKIQDVSTNNTTVPILNENNAAASQVDDIDTSKVFKASTIHGRKKSPYVCATCSKPYFGKDQFLAHIIDHTRERLRNVKPKRQHKKKCVSFTPSDPVGSSSLVKTIKEKEGNLPDNEKNQVDTTSDQENFPDGNNMEILYDNTEVGTKDKLDTIIHLSDDEDVSPSNSDEGDLVTSPTLLAASDALSTSPTVTHRTKPSFGNKISKVNHPESVAINVMDDTIDVSDDEEPTNSKELKCTKKIVKKRHFPHQPLRQNQIPNGGFENKTKANPGPIYHNLPKLNLVKESAVNSRSSCGEALVRVKLLGPAVSLIRTTSPCDTSRTEEKEVADMRLKETEIAVKSSKVCLPQKRATPPSMRETENTVKRLKIRLPLTRATLSTEESANTEKRLKACLPQSRATPPSEIATDFEDEKEESCG